METKQRLGIHFGAMCDKISKQLKTQGFKFEANQVQHFEKQAEAIFRLKISSLISESIAKKAQDKLFKKITTHVNKMN
ncbi:MAG: hypothetical protein AABY22_18820 [Nanoarchaeota archaeon]